MRSSLRYFAVWAGIAVQLATGIVLDVNNAASVKNATSIVARDLLKYYTGNITDGATIGILPGPYYWWEAGAMWGAMVDYYHFTNDATYNNVTMQALISQMGPGNDYMMPAQMFDEGNDDQSFWGFSAMSAAEKGFPAPPSNIPSWIQLVTNLWNTQVVRWDLTSCGGGLKWQIFQSNAGYDYKNSVSNGAFFQLAARLARFTGNQTYVEWAEKSWDWSTRIGLVDPENYNVYDGSDDTKNCSALDHTQFSYSLAVYLYGAAVLYNYTNGSAIWEQRTTGLLNAAGSFFDPYPNATNIMYEASCEETSTCNTDQQSFKAYLSRFMWATTQMAPFTSSAVSTLLLSSASGAAASCSGGADGTTCGSRWYTRSFDNNVGVGQQLAALEVMQGLLINSTSAPITDPGVSLMDAASTVTAVPVPTTPPMTAAAPDPTTTRKSEGVRGRGVVAGSILSMGFVFGIAIGL
ncbi:MAG: hydrolase 76 protein [Pycnora praestabilis]|nr:MAG: hydrolase 76 protein [Pycnora praestabilis]